MSDDPRRWLPSVAALLERPAVASAMTEHGRGSVVSAVRRTLADLRADLRGDGDGPTHDEVETAVVARLRSSDRDRV